MPRWARYGFFVAGAVFVGVLVWHLDPVVVLAALRSASVAPLLITIVFTAAGFWLRAWKWRYALGSGRQAVGLFYIAKMAGHWSPGRIGELSPLLLRAHRNAGVAAWILTDRALEVFTTLAFGLAGVVALNLMRWWMALLLATLLLGSGLVLVFARLPQGNANGTWVERIGWILSRLHREMRLLGKKMPGIVTLTLTAKVTDVLGVVFLCRAFGYSVSFMLVCVARCAHAIVSGVPVTPDATGIPFAAAGYFLHVHGGMPVETLVAAFGIEVAIINVVLYVSFFAGMWTMRRPSPEGSLDHDHSTR